MFNPRVGKWCLLDGKQIAIFCGMDHGHHKTVGEVIISQPTARVANPKPDPTKCQVDLVGVDGNTTSHLLVDIARLTDITKREQIPAARLKTANPNWQPAP